MNLLLFVLLLFWGIVMPPFVKNEKPVRDNAYPQAKLTIADSESLSGIENPETKPQEVVLETSKAQTQIDLGALKRPIKPPEKHGYYVGLHPTFRWKGGVTISRLNFEKITNIKVKRLVLPGVPQNPEEKDKFETRQRYGQVLNEPEEWFVEMKDRVLKTVINIDEGRIRTRTLEKSILEEDPRLDLNRERPFGEFVFMIPVKDCPPDFFEKAFVTWHPEPLIKALEPSLV